MKVKPDHASVVAAFRTGTARLRDQGPPELLVSAGYRLANASFASPAIRAAGRGGVVERCDSVSRTRPQLDRPRAVRAMLPSLTLDEGAVLRNERMFSLGADGSPQA